MADGTPGQKTGPEKRASTGPLEASSIGSIGSIGLLACLACSGACLGAGIGAGIGIGYGIWQGCSPSSSPSSPSCPAGQHAEPLLTYFLASSDVTVTPLNATEFKGVQGAFGEITFPRSSVPGVMPYVTNRVRDGRLHQEVLNTTQFLDDWVVLSGESSPRDGQFAMPSEAAARQCFKGFASEAMSDASVSSTAPTATNAMIRFDSDPSNAVVVDIFDVRATDDGEGYVMTFRQAPASAASQPEAEGACHPTHSMSNPHYHHTSLCADTILEWNVAESLVSGDGMVAFVKAT